MLAENRGYMQSNLQFSLISSTCLGVSLQGKFMLAANRGYVKHNLEFPFDFLSLVQCLTSSYGRTGVIGLVTSSQNDYMILPVGFCVPNHTGIFFQKYSQVFYSALSFTRTSV